MNCQQIQSAMADHSVGLLGVGSTSDYNLHIAACPACAAEARRFERCVSLLCHTPRPNPPANLWLGVRARLELERSVREFAPSAPTPRPARSWWTGAAAAVAGFACALAVIANTNMPASNGMAAFAAAPPAAVSVSLHNGVDSDSPVADASSRVAVDAATIRPLPDLSVSLARFAPQGVAQPSFVTTGVALR